MAKRFTCGTPKNDCSGATTQLSHGIETKLSKTHSSSVEAHKCYTRYLLSQGYKAVGSRELENPTTGAVLVLNKKSKFGGKLKTGKSGKDSGKSSRYMPDKSPGGLIY